MYFFIIPRSCRRFNRDLSLIHARLVEETLYKIPPALRRIDPPQGGPHHLLQGPSGPDLLRRAHLAEPGFVDHHDHFINSAEGTEWDSCLAHAEKLGVGSREYEIIEM